MIVMMMVLLLMMDDAHNLVDDVDDVDYDDDKCHDYVVDVYGA